MDVLSQLIKSVMDAFNQLRGNVEPVAMFLLLVLGVSLLIFCLTLLLLRVCTCGEVSLAIILWKPTDEFPPNPLFFVLTERVRWSQSEAPMIWTAHVVAHHAPVTM